MSKSQKKAAQKKRRKVAEQQSEIAKDISTDKTHPNSREHASLEPNKSIACTHPTRPTRPLAEINDTSKSHSFITPSGSHISVPFINQLFRAQVRVVDFHPADLADFAVRTSEFDNISDAEDDEPPSQPISPSQSQTPPPSAPATLSYIDPDDPIDSRKPWAWFFTLVLQDAHDAGPKGRNDRIAVHVADEDAEFLLGMDAVNLRKESNASVLHELREKLFLLWGDLEERKTAALVARKALAEKDENAQQHGSTAPAQEEDEKARSHRERKELRKPTTPPFVCCVKEFGVEKARGVWKRRFRMFGTSIQ